jgi:hypothetical protein
MFWGAKVQKKVISHRQMQNYYQGNTPEIVLCVSPDPKHSNIFALNFTIEILEKPAI